MKKIFIKIIVISIFIFYSFYKINMKKNEDYTENIINVDNNINKEIKKTNLEIIDEQYKGYDVIAKLKIPKINLDKFVLKNYSLQALKVSITKFWGENPNEIGNFCIAGHNYKEFKNTNKLKINDEIYLTDNYNGTIKYNIYSIYEVYPNETECLSQETNGKKEITLITCNQNSKKRIIIKAKESV